MSVCSTLSTWEDYLEEVLGEKINMTPRNSVTPRPRDMIEGEPVYVFR